MSQDGKYSVLIMRDDADVRRFRISPGLMRGLVWGFALLVLVTGVGLYSGARFWAEGARLAEEKKALERRLIEAEVQLERLSNVESILKSNDPEELQALVGGMGQFPGDTKSGDARSGDARSGAAGKGAGVANPAASAASSGGAGLPLNLAELFESKDMKLAGLENLQIKITGDNAQVRLDLNNLQPERLLNGRVDLLLVSASGKVSPAPVPEAELAFSIQRFKRIQAAFALPEGLDRQTLFALRVIIRSQDGKAIFSETYQIARILAS